MKKGFTFFSLLGLFLMVFFTSQKSHAQCAEIFPGITRVFDTLTSEGYVQAVHIQYRPTSNGRSSIRVDYRLDGEADYSNLACIDLRGLGTNIIRDTTFLTAMSPEKNINIQITTHTNGECGGSICSGDVALEFSSNIALGISLAKFEAFNMDQSVLLNWVTFSESETSGFEIERSRDGLKWEIIGFVASKSENGVSNNILEYEFLDNDVSQGTYLYRLKEITYSNQSQISHIVRVFIGNDKEDRLEIYPNPTQSVINILSDLDAPSYKLMDAMGREVSSKMIMINLTTYDISSLESGFYQLLVLDKKGQVVQTRSIIKL